ncbi:4-hydroxyphenylacetate 3-monooxygenase oxygenase component [Tistrella bauzanensis]|uniref:4-hydroxyphenylacetate 3-monooxygenase oxygenase component n=1 Tax=Tistrella bauzanensis TaxID=657419 RepID=A0ABQ1IGQ8_9PROT|nr:4-hydroxyphenylacetate 3-hydroxylase N-terminal domain-containing protein [Tistrella bauzanensis]GGB40525.1 4-hydroxyphenylacetate 3-monooxygenase oxygenase component [Tistrella bauzanensis]
MTLAVHAPVAPPAPMTAGEGARDGAAYLAGLADGRQVYHAGRLIADVTRHPGFAPAAQTIAGIYDLQSDPAYAGQMTAPWEGAFISASYLPPVTIEQLRLKRRNADIQSRATMGFMGRLPDFCSNLVVGLLNAAEDLRGAGVVFKDPAMAGRVALDCGANAIAYHRFAATRDLALTHALNDQFYDRTKPAAAQPNPDQILRVVRETPEGAVVRGLRNLVTLAPLADEALVYPNRPREAGEADWALAFALPMNAAGLHILCRDLYATHGPASRLPLSSCFDEVDATLIFDDVLVPWERFFVYRDPAMVNRLLGLINPPWAGYVAMTRLAVKLESIAAVAELMTRWDGRAGHRPTHALIGQLLADLEVHRVCLDAMEAGAARTPAGYLAPLARDAFRLHGVGASDRAESLLEDILTSSLILTGGEADLDAPEIGGLVDQFFRGNAPDTRHHLRLMAVAGDMLQSAFGARSQLYERFHMGPPEMIRARLYGKTDREPMVARLQRALDAIGAHPRDAVGQRLG